MWNKYILTKKLKYLAGLLVAKFDLLLNMLNEFLLFCSFLVFQTKSFILKKKIKTYHHVKNSLKMQTPAEKSHDINITNLRILVFIFRYKEIILLIEFSLWPQKNFSFEIYDKNFITCTYHFSYHTHYQPVVNIIPSAFHLNGL